ncbi:MAG: SpoIID/LytB domain-containing protein [Cyanobacteria bacterium Co-bin8]|nr:SpoIID/LytB domain-containing protein [Cyanobacteria bacterium Co-bin8]
MTQVQWPTRLAPLSRQVRRSLMQVGSAALLWGLIALPGLAAPELRVAIRENTAALTVGSSTTAVVRDRNGQGLGQLPGGRSINVASESGRVRLATWLGDAFWVEPTEGGYIFIGDRWYRGRVLVTPGPNGITAVNFVDLEAYLYSVLGGEMPVSWPLEALKSQAVAARSYALYHRNRAQARPYDVASTTASQVYKGLESEAQSTRTAVDATRGQVLTHGGQVIEAVFHSSSGGYTENVEDVWQRPVPYLRAVQDYDVGAPVYQWSVSMPMGDFQRRISGVGQLVAAVPERTTPRGRVVSLRLQGNGGSRVMSGNEVRQALSLRSTLFSISVAGDMVNISGRGYGHGLGMSQWGAHNMASQGRSYRDILTHYYMGTTLAQMQ